MLTFSYLTKSPPKLISAAAHCEFLFLLFSDIKMKKKSFSIANELKLAVCVFLLYLNSSFVSKVFI